MASDMEDNDESLNYVTTLSDEEGVDSKDWHKDNKDFCYPVSLAAAAQPANGRSSSFLVWDGFLYRKDKEDVADRRSYWYCVRDRRQRQGHGTGVRICSARLSMKNGIVKVNAVQHSHEADTIDRNFIPLLKSAGTETMRLRWKGYLYDRSSQIPCEEGAYATHYCCIRHENTDPDGPDCPGRLIVRDGVIDVLQSHCHEVDTSGSDFIPDQQMPGPVSMKMDVSHEEEEEEEEERRAAHEPTTAPPTSAQTIGVLVLQDKEGGPAVPTATPTPGYRTILPAPSTGPALLTPAATLLANMAASPQSFASILPPAARRVVSMSNSFAPRRRRQSPAKKNTGVDMDDDDDEEWTPSSKPSSNRRRASSSKNTVVLDNDDDDESSMLSNSSSATQRRRSNTVVIVDENDDDEDEWAPGSSADATATKWPASRFREAASLDVSVIKDRARTLIWDGFVYANDRLSTQPSAKRSYWRCFRRRKSVCKARVKVRDGEVEVSEEGHWHKRDTTLANHVPTHDELMNRPRLKKRVPKGGGGKARQKDPDASDSEAEGGGGGGGGGEGGGGSGSGSDSGGARWCRGRSWDPAVLIWEGFLYKKDPGLAPPPPPPPPPPPGVETEGVVDGKTTGSKQGFDGEKVTNVDGGSVDKETNAVVDERTNSSAVSEKARSMAKEGENFVDGEKNTGNRLAHKNGNTGVNMEADGAGISTVDRGEGEDLSVVGDREGGGGAPPTTWWRCVRHLDKVAGLCEARLALRDGRATFSEGHCHDVDTTHTNYIPSEIAVTMPEPLTLRGGGHQYKTDNMVQSADGFLRTYWCCILKKNPRSEHRECRGRLVMKDGEVQSLTEHCHDPDPNQADYIPPLELLQLARREQVQKHDVTAKATEGGQPLLVWEGFRYKVMGRGKRFMWCCARNRKGRRGLAVCRAYLSVKRGRPQLRDQHSHPPDTQDKNYIPAGAFTKGRNLSNSPDTHKPSRVKSGRGRPRKVDAKTLMIRAAMKTAVRSFVRVSDQKLLMSGTANGDKLHQCQICRKSFAVFRVMEVHKMLEHKHKPAYQCSGCNMQFIQQQHFNQHCVRVHDMQLYPCPVDGCPETFGYTSYIPRHMRLVHPGVDMPDRRTQKKEPSVVVGVENGFTRFRGSVYRCHLCPAEYPHLCKLKYHMRKHTGESPYKCSQCPKAFKSSGQRLAHMQINHLKVRRHLCDTCGKKFRSFKCLRDHSVTHTGEKRFQCPVCARCFSKGSSLKVHMRQHTGEKPYVCEKCGQAFTVRVSLRTHLKSKHNIHVDTSAWTRTDVDPGDNSLPAIGRPKVKDTKKKRQQPPSSEDGGGGGGKSETTSMYSPPQQQQPYPHHHQHPSSFVRQHPSAAWRKDATFTLGRDAHLSPSPSSSSMGGGGGGSGMLPGPGGRGVAAADLYPPVDYSRHLPYKHEGAPPLPPPPGHPHGHHGVFSALAESHLSENDLRDFSSQQALFEAVGAYEHDHTLRY